MVVPEGNQLKGLVAVWNNRTARLWMGFQNSDLFSLGNPWTRLDEWQNGGNEIGGKLLRTLQGL